MKNILVRYSKPHSKLIAATVMIISLLLFLFAYGNSDKKEITNDQLSSIVEVDKGVHHIIKWLRVKSDSDRISIMRFHDGPKDFFGVSNEVVSEIYHTESDDFILKVDPESLQEIPMSVMVDTILPLWENDGSCSILNEGNIRNPYQKKLLTLHKFKQALSCSIINDNGAPLGIITLYFDRILTKRELSVIYKDTIVATDYIKKSIEKKVEIGLPIND